MPELVAPTVRLHTAWLAAHDEWGGVLEDIRDTDLGPARRYWITL
ncbi:hypothetical protein [Micromonospora sp. NPDC005189]